MNFDTAQSNLDELLSKTKNRNLNEAETRFQIIDEILTNSLGWTKGKNLHVEVHHKGDFSDYELGAPIK